MTTTFLIWQKSSPLQIEIVAGNHELLWKAEGLLIKQVKVLQGIERMLVGLVSIDAAWVQGHHQERPRLLSLFVSTVLVFDKLLNFYLKMLKSNQTFYSGTHREILMLVCSPCVVCLTT